MSNSQKVSINYTPRYTDQEAYDLCPPAVRRALGVALCSWSASAALRHSRKHGWKATVAWLKRGDELFLKKRNWNRELSPCVQVGVEPLR